VTEEYLVEEIPVAIDPIIDPAPRPAPEQESEPSPDERAERLVASIEQDGPMTEDEFAEVADALGLTVRVVRLDGEDLAITMDFSPTRANVEVANGLVVAVLNFG
jgi:hypothetical protein